MSQRRNEFASSRKPGNRSNLADQKEMTMKWETPEYNDIRFGFEVTMYINNR
jgi:coenzyme PQQ precursor peptide PqqA